MSAQKELPGLAVESVPQATLDKAALVMEPLQSVTSLSVVSEFLKSKGVPHSAGSWEEMHEKRIAPSLHSKKITLPELVHLLGEAEELGAATFSSTLQRRATLRSAYSKTTFTLNATS